MQVSTKVKLGLIVGVIAWWVNSQIEALKRITFDVIGVKDFSIKNLTPNSFTFFLTIQLSNPLKSGMNINGLVIEIYFMNSLLTTISLQDTIPLANEETKEANLPVRIDNINFIKALPQLYAQNVKSEFLIKSAIKLGFITIPLPDETLKLPI